MASPCPQVYVTCPKSDREWREHTRRWSDVPGLFSLRCPSCGVPLRLAVESHRIVPLPGWVGRQPEDHELSLTGVTA